jgi:hypothetical protein
VLCSAEMVDVWQVSEAVVVVLAWTSPSHLSTQGVAERSEPTQWLL